MKAFWARVRQGFTILGDRRRYLREVFAVQFAGWLFRFAAFWMLLEAFNVGGSVKNVLLVLGVNAVSAAVPFTPQGAGVQQALLVKVFAGTAAAGTVAAYSVGQQIFVGALTFGIGFAALAFLFRIRSFKEVIARGREDRASEDCGPPRHRPRPRARSRSPRAPRARGSRPRGRSCASPAAGPGSAARRCPGGSGAGCRTTVMSTASLIALSAQATFCAPCICSANSAIRRRSSSGSPNSPPKGSSELMPQL